MAGTKDILLPPLDGSLLLPELFAFNARHNTDRPFYIFSNDNNGDGLTTITHLEFYRACHRVAHALRPNRTGLEGEVIAIIAQTDSILYAALIVGTMIAGAVPFPMSPRNSAAAVTNMLQKTGCHRIISTQYSMRALLDEIRTDIGLSASKEQTFELSIEEIPTLAQVFPQLGSEQAHNPFEYFPESPTRSSVNDTTLYLHSSGSTGFPKPIPQTHLNAIHWCTCSSISDLNYYPLETRIGAMSLPSFHTLGIMCLLYIPVSTLRTISVYPPTSFHDPNASPVIPTSENILDCLRKTGTEILLVVPSFIEQWASSPEAIETLRTLRCIAYSGGPLSQKLGDILSAAGVTIRCIYGATEFGAISSWIRSEDDEKDWSWMRFGPLATIRWVPQGDDTYECQVLTTKVHQVSVENLPDVKGYATADLFIKHPTKELWKVVGRADDVLILASGEKTVPAPMEDIIASNPFVAGTAMFGRERNQVGIIVEPKKGYEVDINDFKQVAEFRNKIWSEVEEANRTAPAFSRIFKEMILVAHPDKPMLRTGKGTVMKKGTVKAYEEDINDLYDTVEESTRAGNDVPLPKSWTEEELQGWLMAHVAIVNSGKEVDPEADFFEQGFDSLTATFLKNRVIGSLKSSPDLDIRAAAGRINQNIVFNSPSIKLLSGSLANLIANRETNGQNGSLSDEEEIEKMIAKYSGGLPEASTPVEHIANGHSGHVVLLTGSTGGLGSYLLASLLEHEAVRHVIAFNRPSKGRVTIEERQKSAFEDRGLDISLLQLPKLQYLEGDAAQERLSLDEASYNELRTSTTIIIHNAWRLDFNLSLSSFEPNIKGTRNLINLALSSPHASNVRFLFTSSISSAQGWDQSKGPFPEEVQFNPSVASHGSGYGASKYVCERLLEKSGLQASSFRIGQVSGGSPRGAWSITDWLPIIVKSSVGLGALPIAKGVVAWLPPHAVSNAIIDVAFSKATPQIALNLVHPRPVEWASLMKPVGEALVRKNLITAPLPLVPFYEWFTKVEVIAAKASEEELKTIPAVKLLEFMRALASADKSIRELGREDAEATGFAAFSTTKSQQVSQTMRELPPLVSADAELWVDYWDAVGMFA